MAAGLHCKPAAAAAAEWYPITINRRLWNEWDRRQCGRCGEGRWKAHCRFWWDWLIICLVVCSFLDSIFTYALLLTLISWYFHHCIPKNIRSGDTSRHITISITQRPDNARLALPQRYCRIRRRGINLHISIRHFHQGILLSDVTINWWGIKIMIQQ